MGTAALKKALGKLIVELRNEHQLSQEKLAFEAAVDRTRLGEIERGGANPTLDTLDRIARAVGQSLGTLIIQAEKLASGAAKRSAPTVNPEHIDRSVPLPKGLTHDRSAPRTRA